jgi:hypothetical protein
LQGEWFLQKCFAALEGAFAHDGVFCVSGKLEHFHFGARGDGLVGKFPAVHSGITTSVMMKRKPTAAGQGR